MGVIMGARGKAPTPSALRLVKSERERAAAAAEPMPGDADVEPPGWLDEQARAVWDRLAPDMRAKGVLTSWDVDLFGVLCDAVARFAEAAQLVSDAGVLVVGDKDRLVKNPACQLVRDYSQIMTSVGGRFGLTPSDRVSLVGSGKDSGVESNPFAV